MITIISSTNRQNSYSAKVANLIFQQLQNKGEKVQLLDLIDLPHDFIFSSFDGRKNPAMENLIEKNIIGADKFIFVIPEYNGAFPGILKSFIDCVPPRHFYGKQAALVGVADGHAGALRALDMFTLVLNYIRVNVHWNKPKLSDITHKFEITLDEVYQKRIDDMLLGFL